MLIEWLGMNEYINLCHLNKWIWLSKKEMIKNIEETRKIWYEHIEINKFENMNDNFIFNKYVLDLNNEDYVNWKRFESISKWDLKKYNWFKCTAEIKQNGWTIIINWELAITDWYIKIRYKWPTYLSCPCISDKYNNYDHSWIISFKEDTDSMITDYINWIVIDITN